MTEHLVIDNLKSGVLKPDIYDPVFNPAYADFVEHYGTLIDTPWVARPTDQQGKSRADGTAGEKVLF